MHHSLFAIRLAEQLDVAPTEASFARFAEQARAAAELAAESIAAHTGLTTRAAKSALARAALAQRLASRRVDPAMMQSAIDADSQYAEATFRLSMVRELIHAVYRITDVATRRDVRGTSHDPVAHAVPAFELDQYVYPPSAVLCDIEQIPTALHEQAQRSLDLEAARLAERLTAMDALPAATSELEEAFRTDERAAIEARIASLRGAAALSRSEVHRKLGVAPEAPGPARHTFDRQSRRPRVAAR